MSEPDWAKVLYVLYSVNEPISTPANLEETPPDNKLIQETDLEADEIEECLVFLRRQGLIEMPTFASEEIDSEGEERDIRNINLMQDGFRVAHDREQAFRERRTNSAVAVFTSVLAVTAILETLIIYVTEELTLLQTTTMAAIILLLVFGVGWYFIEIYKTGLFTVGRFSE